MYQVENGDWDILANEWDKEELEEWWLDVQFETVEPEAEEDEFEVDEGIKTDIVLWDLFEIWAYIEKNGKVLKIVDYIK